MADLPGEDLMLLRQKVAPKASAAPAPSAAAVRRVADKKQMLKSNDGRRRRKSTVVRDAQINFKVAADTKTAIVEAARAMGMPMVWVLERGLELVQLEAAGKLTITEDTGDKG